MTSTRDHGRYPYSALPDRPVFDWPNGKRLAVYVALNIETFSFGEGDGAALAPKEAEKPDVLNYAWREWGNRIGVWRMKDAFDALDMPLAVLPNSCVYEDCPGLIEAFRERGDEIVCHGRTNAEKQGLMGEAEERALIREAADAFRRHEGELPAGWLAPWISQSEASVDLLAEEGFSYLLDWCHDDQPTFMAARNGGRILSVPYSHEINDIPAVTARYTGADEFADMIVAQFDEMLEASERAPAVMSIALHPYISGQPFRLRALKRALKHVADRREDVWLTRPGAIAEAFARIEREGS